MARTSLACWLCSILITVIGGKWSYYMCPQQCRIQLSRGASLLPYPYSQWSNVLILRLINRQVVLFMLHLEICSNRPSILVISQAPLKIIDVSIASIVELTRQGRSYHLANEAVSSVKVFSQLDFWSSNQNLPVLAYQTYK